MILKTRNKKTKGFFFLFLIVLCVVIIFTNLTEKRNKIKAVEPDHLSLESPYTMPGLISGTTTVKIKQKCNYRSKRIASFNKAVLENAGIEEIKERNTFINIEAAALQEIPIYDSINLMALNGSAFNEETIKKGILEFTPKETSIYEPSQVYNVAVTGVNDFWSLLKRPFNLDKKDAASLLMFTGGAIALIRLDDAVHFEVLKQHGLSANSILNFGEAYGTPKITFTASLTLASAGFILKDKELVQTGLEVFESYFIANNITALLKRTIGRARPSANKGENFYTPFSSQPNGDNSFPSGHTTLAFSLSTILASHVENGYLKTLIYVPAVVTGISRVAQNYHWVSDVFFGGVIGYCVGNFVSKNHLRLIPDNMLLLLDNRGEIGFQLKF